ncbi:hypothetical protein L1987_57428 [Smallanthus sonchifolius]|uniref:Uncharacterized protein n=1 Tax=Smallanthus sonchifolius TaxID=185202 RepID=A0ACB9DCK6_9ASTR|nr:hypothetical protein L1987_57428 [Smallanthus sonchifolius]
MAVDVCTSSELFISPRISFSHDLNNQSSETAAIGSTNAAITTTTFDFFVTPHLKLPPITSADELFLDGVLLPTQTLNPKPKATVLGNEVMDVHRKRLKELLSEDNDKQEKSSSRSFWKFTRTTSLNSSNGTGTKRLLRSLSLKRMLHSHSTLNPRGNEDIKLIKKSNLRKEPVLSSSCFSSIHTPSVPSGCSGDDSRPRSLTKKDSGGGIQINPVLNIPPVYNTNLFGYGSLFCRGKSKNKNK